MLRNLKFKIKDFLSGDSLSIFLILAFFFLFSFLIIFRLYNLQIVKGEYFRSKVVKISQEKRRNEIFDRGKIYFKNKDEFVPVAIQDIGCILIINNKDNLFYKNNDIENVYKKINSITSIDKKLFLKKAKSFSNEYGWFKKKVSLKDWKKIKRLKFDGINCVRQSWRYYPFNQIGGKILGFLNIDKQGSAGLEKYYNKELLRDFKKEKKNIFFDIFSKDMTDLFQKKEIKREGNLYTSIDINIQDFLERELIKINKKYKSRETFGIVIKPATGEIIAMSDNTPMDFNLIKKDYRNKMVEYRYEPGSIIKPLIVSMALDSKSISKNFSYTDRGCINIQSYKVCNYDKKARGKNVNLIEIIKNSLNLGMVSIQKHIKYKTFLEYFTKKLALGEETGIDLPNENSQNIQSINHLNTPINYATAAFGQGISFTPIAMLRGLSIIANDGFLVRPHIVSEINYGSLIPSKFTDTKKKRVLDIQAVEEIKKIMVEAVDQSSQKQKFLRKGYSVAAKTGTAQIASKKGGYKEGVNLHTFFGFFPVETKPENRYAIILYTFEPKAKYSSQTLTKPFFNLVDFLTSYYNIKPDRLK